MLRRIISKLRPLPRIDDPARAPFELVVDGIVHDRHATRIFGDERFRVCVFPETDGGLCEECGTTCYWLDLQFLDFKKREWVSMQCIHEARVSVMQGVLDEVSRFLEEPRDSAFQLSV